MNKLIFKLKMCLDKEELTILTKSLNLYILASTTFDYPDEIEICRDILRKIRRNFSTEYLPENKLN